MRLFKRIREKRINEIIERVYKKNILERYIMLLVGIFIVAFTFNLFFLRYNIVCFGVSGIAIVLAKFGISPSTFILGANIFLLIVSYFFLGIDDVKNQLVGALIYPIFVKITSLITDLIDLGNLEFIIIAVMGGVLAGVGYGLVYKSGFSSGGTDVIGNLLCKYSKISMGNAMMFVNCGIILIGKLVFSWKVVMYAIVVAYLISIVTDKILLGISNSKAFYIVVDTDKDNLVNDFLLSIQGVGSTIIDASGGYENDNQTLIMAVVPTRMYFIIKEGLEEIDQNIFYLVCDAYEVSHRGNRYEQG